VAATRRERTERAPRDEASAVSSTGVVEVSFEDTFDAQLADELGDLGPKSERPAPEGGGRSGGRRRHR
jgi:polyribonucleotide nucleotidyltransferase